MEQEPAGPADEFTDAMSLPTDRAASQKIEAIKLYVKKEDPPWETIIEVAQRLLEAEQDSLLEVKWQDDAGRDRVTKVSVRAEVNRLIGSFPEQGLQFYQLTYGPRAEEMLKQALEKNDLHLLADVSQRYLHTKAGGKATLLLGTYYLDRGHYHQAASCFERLGERADAKELDAKTLFKAALAFRRAGDAEKGERFWERFARAAGRDGVAFAGRKFTPEELRAVFDRQSELTVAALDAWPVYRGNAARNAQGIGSSPFLDPRFEATMFPISIVEEDKDQAARDWIRQNLEDSLAVMEDRSITALPAFYPVAANGLIIFRTYKGLTAVYADDDPSADPPIPAGEVAWRTGGDYSLYSMVNESPKQTVMNSLWWQRYRQEGPYGVLFENGLLGTLSHDGKYVYFIDDLAVPPHPLIAQQYGLNPRGGPAVPAFQEQVDHNILRAYELDTGRFKWHLGGKNPNPGAEPPGPAGARKPTPADLLDAHFLGAPLPVSGKLYVLMEKDGELQLVCLDPEKLTPFPLKPIEQKPEVVWIQKLGSPNVPVDKDSLRRIQGVNLAYADGVLVCPTNAGVIIGVELLTRSLLWAHSYREPDAESASDAPGPGIIIRNGRRVVIGRPVPGAAAAVNLNEERWRCSVPVLVNGKVVFTAYDSASVQCLDLRTGKLLWKSPRGPEDLYLAGVYDGKVIIVGKDSVRALSLEDGKKVLWKLPSGLPSGVGVASDDVYYLPVRKAADSKEPEVWAIDLKSGRLIARTKSRKKEVPGNLVFYKGDVYSQTPFGLVAYPQLRRQLEEMNRRLAANPNDPVGLTERGALQLDDGKLVAAITDLRDALRHDPPPTTRERARLKLYEAITELLQRDFAAGEPYLETYEELCNVSVPEGTEPARRRELEEEGLRRRSTYLCLLAKGREKQGRLVEAFEHYMAFGTLTGNEELVPSIDEPNTMARPDVWARGRIEAMIRSARPEDRAPLEAKLRARWEQARDGGTLEELRDFVRLFGSMFSVGRRAKLELAERLAASGGEDAMREAELLLAGLREEADDPATAARAVEALARLFVRKATVSGDDALFHDAVGFYTELGRRYADVPVRDGKTGADFFNDLLTDKRFLPYLEPVRQLWDEPLKAQEVHGANAVMRQSSFTLDPEGADLPFYRRHRLVIDMNPAGNGNWQLRVVDRVTGEDKWKYFPLPPIYSQYLRNFQQSGFQFAYARGHILVLNLNHEVFAFDLAGRKKLWDRNLLGDNPTAPGQVPNQIHQMMEPDGLRLIYPDGWTQKLGQVGVIEASYVCLLTRDGLVALDPASGSVLWTKSDVSPRVELYGDHEYIFLVESNPDGSPCPTRAVRARDGVSVEVPDASALFANPRRRLAVVGRRLLLADDPPGKKVLRLYDLLTGKDVWRKELDGRTVLVRSDDPGLVGFVTPAGEVTLLNVRTAREVFAARLDANKVTQHLDKVQEARLLQDAGRYYVCLNRPTENGVGVTPWVTNGLRSLRVNGPVYCFDRFTGKRLWYTDEQFENQAILLEQFEDLPVIIAAAQCTEANNGNLRSQAVRIIALDKRTGAARYRKETAPGSQFYALVADPQRDEIELVRPDMRIRFAPEGSAPTARAGAADPALERERLMRAQLQAELEARALRLRAIQRAAPGPVLPAPPPPPRREK
ncbi:MAG TPA: PQQ-binding-like beta-propeller repeat protein, partial [Gemmataceae bacterium]